LSVFMSNFRKIGKKPASRTTAMMQIIPPAVTEKVKENAAAIEAARICPAKGPSEYDNNSIPARRPR